MDSKETKYEKRRKVFMAYAKHPTLKNLVRCLCYDVWDIIKGNRHDRI